MTYLVLYQSWRIRLNSLPTLVVFFYRNLMGILDASASKIMPCLSGDNVDTGNGVKCAFENREGITAPSIIPLKVVPY